MQIMQYDHAWPGEFEKLRNQLAVSLQPWLQGPTQHVGSTAVPGLAAKPIIDMAAPVRSIVQAHHAIPVLELAGWMSWPSDPNRSWRLWFLRPRPEARTHHLYLIQHDDPHLRELTAFRDRLRTDASACDQYAHLKQLLAQRYSVDRDAYTAAKTNFVVTLLRQAGIEPQPRPDIAVADRIPVLPATKDLGDDAAAQRLLALVTGGGQDRVDEALRRYRDDPNAQLLVAMYANETVGLAGYRVATDAAEIELLHLATASHVRRRGVAAGCSPRFVEPRPPGCRSSPRQTMPPCCSTQLRGSP